MINPIISLPNNIIVRDWLLSDVESAAYHANNYKIWRNLTDRFPFPYTVAHSEWWVNFCADQKNWLPTTRPVVLSPMKTQPVDSPDVAISTDAVPAKYAICHDNRAIGSIGFEFDPKTPRSLSLGYWLGEEYWGRGLMTMITKAYVAWAFDTFPWIVRIDADAFSWNEGSQRVLEKVGFEHEGRAKYKAFKEGNYGDLVYYGMLREGFMPDLMQTNGP